MFTLMGVHENLFDGSGNSDRWVLKPAMAASWATASRLARARLGDFPMEYLQEHSGLPIGQDSLVKITPESKNEMYTLLDAALFREPGDPLQFSY